MVFPTDPLQVRVEIALGADITGDPDLWSWTDISAYVRTADGAKVVVRRGRRNDSGSVAPATASFDLDNTDGRFCTQNPMSPYFPLLQVNTPVRLSVSTDSGGSWSVRYSGYLSKLPASWRGAAASDSWVSVTAESVLRRLAQQGSHSPLYWSAPNLGTSVGLGCVEYWPMEDGKAAAECASFFPDGIPMTVSGSIELGASSPPAGSEATPQSDYEFMKANPPSATGIVRPYTGSGDWTVLGMFKTDEGSAVDTVLMDMDINHGESSTDPDQVRLVLQTDRLTLQAFQEDDTLLGSVTTGALTIEPGDGQWHAVSVQSDQSGADVIMRVRYEGTSYSFTIVGRTMGTLRKIAFPSTTMTTEPDLLAVGHLAVYNEALHTSYRDQYANAMKAYYTGNGESADTRLERLDSESGLMSSLLIVTADLNMFERLGEQPKSNILGVAEDAVEADGGLLFEPKSLSAGALRYYSRSLLNSTAISAPSLTLTQDDFSIIEQGDDDHLLVTQATVSGAGSSAKASASAVENEISVSRNVRFAERLPDHAGWVLYQGTRRDYRYPRIQVLLHGATSKIADWVGIELGERVLITDPPPGVVNDIDMLLEGYQEAFDQYTWIVDLYCSPASRYRIARLDDTTYGRMDTAGARLVNAVTSSATTLDVEAYEGPEWTGSDGLTLTGAMGDYASTPDDASLDLTGDMEVEFDIEPVTWASGATQAVVGKFNTPNRSFAVTLRSTGELGFGYSTDGSALVTRPSTVAVTGGRKQCKIEFDADNGAAGHTVRFYTRPPGGTYTQLGADVTNAGTVTVFSGTAPLEVGANTLGTSSPFNGVIRSVTVRSSIGGTVVAAPDFEAQPFGTTSFADSTGKTWTIHGNAVVQANLGFSVGVGGERMTATGITGSFKDTFTRSVSNGWGTSDSGHAWSTSGGVAADYNVNGARGIISVPAVNSLRSTYIAGLSTASIDRTFTVRVPVLATGADIQVRAVARWDVAASTYYMAQLEIETSNAVTLVLRKAVTGTNTTLQTTITSLTHTASTDYRLRFKVQGSWLYAKVWDATSIEPTQWTGVAYDTSITAAGAWGMRCALSTGNTNALPVAIQFDDDSTPHPQKFTVTRSVNEVVKAHAAGDAVGLFQPNHLGL